MLQKKNISLVEPGHIYQDEDGKIYTSVTTLIKMYAPPFDKEFFSKKKAKELGITQEEVLKMWEQNGIEASNAGTFQHNVAEKIALGVELDDMELDYVNPIKAMFEKFDLVSTEIFPEKRVYHPEWGICGTADGLIPKEGKMNIIDYKTCKDPIRMEGGYWTTDKFTDERVYVLSDKKKFKKPISHLPHSKGNEYALQLSIYMYILEQWGMVPGFLKLWQIRNKELGEKENTGIELPYLREEAKAIIEDFLKKQLESWGL